jgi:hypothetical protein
LCADWVDLHADQEGLYWDGLHADQEGLCADWDGLCVDQDKLCATQDAPCVDQDSRVWYVAGPAHIVACMGSVDSWSSGMVPQVWGVLYTKDTHVHLCAPKDFHSCFNKDNYFAVKKSSGEGGAGIVPVLGLQKSVYCYIQSD